MGRSIKNKKVLVIGLDGATWKVITPLIKKGKLPFLKSMIDGGASGILESVLPPITAPSWVSLQTGVNPGKHGIFEFINYRSNPNNPEVVDATMIKRKTIWDYLKDNHSSLIMNMPVTYPVRKINGVIISSFLTPDNVEYVYPKKYKKDLIKNNYVIDALHKDVKFKEADIFDSRKEIGLNLCLEIVNSRINTAKDIINKENFSFIFLLIKETDVIQHTYWKKNNISKFYIELDSILGSFYKYLVSKSDNLDLLIVSDHGFHDASDIEFSPYNWMKENGFIKSELNKSRAWATLSFTNKIINKLKVNLDGSDFSESIKKNLINKEKGRLYKEENIIVANEGLYFIGMSEEKKNEYKVKIVNEMSKIKYKNKKVFKIIMDSNKYYSGENTYLGPDIIWVSNESFSLNLSPLTKGTFNKRKLPFLGTHNSDTEGIYIINGSSIAKKKGHRINIIDIMPTILYLLGVDIPGDIDGTLPIDIFIKEEQKRIFVMRNEVKKQVNKEIKRLKYES